MGFMHSKHIIFGVTLIFFLANTGMGMATDRLTVQPGYHKAVFWDRGEGMDDSDLPVFKTLACSYESNYALNPSLQKALIAGNNFDCNGILLYPDNSPRYKVLFTPGGDSRGHGKFLTAKGLENIRTFVKKGGSYVGICGGAALSALSRKKGEVWPEYYHLWPGYLKMYRNAPLFPDLYFTSESDLTRNFTGQIPEKILGIKFTNGSYPIEADYSIPEGTKIHLRYKINDSRLDKKIACWSYKKNREAGIVIVINSHPEIQGEGNHLKLMQAIFYYALAGTGTPEIKGELKNNEIRKMVSRTRENNPNFCRIGDRQIHLFHFDLDFHVKDLKVELDRDEDVCFNIYLYNIIPSDYQNHKQLKKLFPGKKMISFSRLEAGSWYLGIECLAEVTGTPEDPDFLSRNHSVLEGCGYQVKLIW